MTNFIKVNSLVTVEENIECETQKNTKSQQQAVDTYCNMHSVGRYWPSAHTVILHQHSSDLQRTNMDTGRAVQ